LIRDGCPSDRLMSVPTQLLPEESTHTDSQPWVESMRKIPTFLYVGHFLHNKGVDAVIEAFSEVRAEEKALVLAWSGFGDVQEIRAQISSLGLVDQVRIVEGRVPREALFREARALILPYRAALGQVSPPLLVLEAMRTGIPLLMSELPGVSEWVHANQE